MADDDARCLYAIGVGSNRGDRRQAITQAANALTSDGSCTIQRQSALHPTQPVGGPSGQGEFLNGAWLVATALGPHQLLVRLQTIESALGRVRAVHWGARTIDLDLLLRADGLIVSTPVLTLPHPRIAQRAFVLMPLAEVVPDWTLERPLWLAGRSCGRRITVRELAGLVASQQGAGP
jgi:2-amino-4-hydroxy-6-hydroxymethyldihydropteridine diphosphokinase